MWIQKQILSLGNPALHRSSLKTCNILICRNGFKYSESFEPGNRNSARGGAELILTMCFFFFLCLLTCFLFFDPDCDSCRNLTGSSPSVNSPREPWFSAGLKGQWMCCSVEPKLKSPLMRSPIILTFHVCFDVSMRQVKVPKEFLARIQVKVSA